MALTAAELPAVLERARSAVENAGSPKDAAAVLVAGLRAAWPNTVIACRLEGPAGTAVAAIDAQGRPDPDLAAGLADMLAGPSGDAVFSGIKVRVVPLEIAGRSHGALAVAVPPDEVAILSGIARTIAEVLDRTSLADELADRDWLADLGEVVGPVTHEFNNFLNTLMLQIAVMEMSAPEGLKAELHNVKRQGKQVAGVVKQLQQYRRRGASDPRPADLSRAAAAAVETLEQTAAKPDGGPRVRRVDAAEPGDVPLRLSLAGDLPLVSGPAADLRRLCRFLLAGAAWAVAGGGSLRLSTQAGGAGATLTLEAVGASDGMLARRLDGTVTSDGGYGLELAACQSVVRRLGGAVRTEPISGGEMIVVELPAASRTATS